MLNRDYLLITSAAVGLLFAGCAVPMQPPPAEQLDECETYDSMTVSGEIDGEWALANDENEHTFTVPVEPGAGIVEVTLSGPPVGSNPPKLGIKYL